MKQHHQNEDE
jgi:hypothetical protein